MIKDEIYDSFLKKLDEYDDIDQPLLVRLRTILKDGKKPDVDDLVAAYKACQKRATK